MPLFRDWIDFFILNLLFIIIFSTITFSIMMKKIKENWDENRCNPMFMLMADNVGENFTFCVQNIQGNFTGHLLEPVHYLIGGLTQLGGNLVNDLGGVRSMMSYIRDSTGGLVSGVYEKFINIILGVSHTMINLNDVIHKIVGIFAVLSNTLEGSFLSIESLWNGPPGKLVQGLGCFHPTTKIRMGEGSRLKEIQHIKLDDVLYDNNRVIGVMMFFNSEKTPFYMMEGEVLVTGNHYVLYEEKWIKVKKIRGLPKSAETSPIIYNLITEKGVIHIGDWTFCDYNDDKLNYPLYFIPSIMSATS